MEERRFLKPHKPGIIIPDPKYGDNLPDEGRKVKLNKYWIRLIMSKQVIECEEPKKKKTTKKKTKKIKEEKTEK